MYKKTLILFFIVLVSFNFSSCDFLGNLADSFMIDKPSNSILIENVDCVLTPQKNVFSTNDDVSLSISFIPDFSKAKEYELSIQIYSYKNLKISEPVDNKILIYEKNSENKTNYANKRIFFERKDIVNSKISKDYQLILNESGEFYAEITLYGTPRENENKLYEYYKSYILEVQ